MKYLALGFALLMVACSPRATEAPAPPPSPVAAAAPAPEAMTMVFAGDLPCADCPGIRTELTLTRDAPYSGDGKYKLVETYIHRGAPITSTGIWGTLRGDAVDPDATVYELNPEKPEPARRHFRRVGDDEALKVLGGDRTPLPDSLPSTLKRAK